MPRAPTRGPDLDPRPQRQRHPHLTHHSPTPLPSDAPRPDAGPSPRSSTAAPTPSSPHTSQPDSAPFRCPAPRRGVQTSILDRGAKAILTSHIAAGLRSLPMPRAPTRGPDLDPRPQRQGHPHLTHRSRTPLPSDAPRPRPRSSRSMRAMLSSNNVATDLRARSQPPSGSPKAQERTSPDIHLVTRPTRAARRIFA